MQLTDAKTGDIAFIRTPAGYVSAFCVGGVVNANCIICIDVKRRFMCEFPLTTEVIEVYNCCGGRVGELLNKYNVEEQTILNILNVCKETVCCSNCIYYDDGTLCMFEGSPANWLL